MIKIDESFTLLNDVLRGRKPKFKLIKDGATYIYKYGAINNEIWAELISEQLGLHDMQSIYDRVRENSNLVILKK